MSINKTPAGTAHVKLLAAKAIESPEGITVIFPSQQEAVRMRALFNSMRFKDRADAKKIYPPEHPQHGLSFYDSLETVIYNDDGKWKFTLRNYIDGLKDLEIIDNATGTAIKGEDL